MVIDIGNLIAHRWPLSTISPEQKVQHRDDRAFMPPARIHRLTRFDTSFPRLQCQAIREDSLDTRPSTRRKSLTFSVVLGITGLSNADEALYHIRSA
jgi:hypothetical protein